MNTVSQQLATSLERFNSAIAKHKEFVSKVYAVIRHGTMRDFREMIAKSDTACQLVITAACVQLSESAHVITQAEQEKN